MNCKKVWELILALDPPNHALQDAFCDFETDWEEHQREFHPTGWDTTLDKPTQAS